MWGKGKSYFGLTLFESLMSTQTLILLSFLETTTMLDTHWGYLATSKKPTSHCFFTFFLTLISTLNLALLSLCLTNLHPFIKGNLYTKISMSKLVISAYDHVNTLAYSFIRDIKPHLSLVVINTLIFNFFLSCSKPTFTNSNSSLPDF